MWFRIALMSTTALLLLSVFSRAEVKSMEIWTSSYSGKQVPPFSFVYGGKTSAEFIGSWKVTDKTSRLNSTTRQRTITWTDSKTALEVKAVVKEYTDTGGSDWILYFTNRGSSDAPILEDVRALDLSLTAGMKPVFHSIHGCYPHSWQPFDVPLRPGEPVVVGATNGCSSETHSPFFNVETDGGGVIVGVGWTGQWTASVALSEGRVRAQAGMELLHLSLRPGESIRSPRILAVPYQCDEADSYNVFRKVMLAHIMPRAHGKLQTPPIAHLSTAFDELNLTDEESVLSHLKAVKGLGFDHLWLDAYFTKGGFPNGMGNYGVPPDKVIPDPIRFPNGLKPVAEAVQKGGMKFLVWFEPERVAAGTLIAREHPEFVISPDGNGSGLLNLGIPAAREYMTKAMDAAIKEWKLGCIRFDYNISPLGYWQFENAKDSNRVGITEIRYVEGLYRMWDALRAANPELLIDNCASGGKRIDLETCSRALALWRTDATITPLWSYDFGSASVLNQLMTGGLNRFIPYSTSGQMGAAPYNFRSGVNGGGISFAEDVRSASAKGDKPRLGREQWGSVLKDLYGAAGYPIALLKQGIAEAKRTRKYTFGDFFVQSPMTASPTDWCVSQYNRAKEGDGIVVAFRRPGAPATFKCMGLRGIDPSAEYLVSFAYSYKPLKPVRMKGSVLQKLELKIDECPGSVLVEYKKAP